LRCNLFCECAELLAIDAVAWVLGGVFFFALPTQSAQRLASAILPAHAGEIVVMLWLLIRGVRSTN